MVSAATPHCIASFCLTNGNLIFNLFCQLGGCRVVKRVKFLQFKSNLTSESLESLTTLENLKTQSLKSFANLTILLLTTKLFCL